MMMVVRPWQHDGKKIREAWNFVKRDVQIEIADSLRPGASLSLAGEVKFCGGMSRASRGGSKSFAGLDDHPR
jgi:hypothetical protein